MSLDPKVLHQYCWLHGFCVNQKHNSHTCKAPKDGHKMEATKNVTMDGSNLGLHDIVDE